jgi:broad specificity phosphatase PhoE
MSLLARLFVVRHGQTALNNQGALRGHLEVPLDAVGEGEAESLGGLFERVDAEAVVSSPLLRAQQTAAAIAARAMIDVVTDPDLIDRDYGRWAGTPRDEVERAFGSLGAAPGVEPVEQLIRRVTVALERWAEQAASRPVILVAHDAVNRHALARLVPDLGAADDIPQRTGCWNRLDRHPWEWSAPIVDAVPHDGHRP